MTTESLIDEYEKLIKRINESTQEQIFDELFKPFFRKYGDTVKSVVWSQYTPYFNDGDACTFSINEIYFCTKVVSRFSWDLEDDEDEANPTIPLSKPWGYRGNNDEWDKHPEVTKACNKLRSDMGRMAFLFERVLGDHISVSASADGFNIEEYNHD